jgi:hypothetical protein
MTFYFKKNKYVEEANLVLHLAEKRYTVKCRFHRGCGADVKSAPHFFVPIAPYVPLFMRVGRVLIIAHAAAALAPPSRLDFR